MKSCKFCGVVDGAPDRSGKAAHINRDKLCAPCYRVLEKVKYQPEKLDADTHAWFVEMCQFNMRNGMFVPVAQRRGLQHLKPPKAWRCKKCGETKIEKRDGSYTNYCLACAGDIRRGRDMSGARKTRKDCHSYYKV